MRVKSSSSKTGGASVMVTVVLAVASLPRADGGDRDPSFKDAADDTVGSEAAGVAALEASWEGSLMFFASRLQFCVPSPQNGNPKYSDGSDHA